MGPKLYLVGLNSAVISATYCLLRQVFLASNPFRGGGMVVKCAIRHKAKTMRRRGKANRPINLVGIVRQSLFSNAFLGKNKIGAWPFAFR